MRDRLASVLRPVRRAVLARRRLLAALLTAVAVAAGLHAVAAPAAGPGRRCRSPRATCPPAPSSGRTT